MPQIVEPWKVIGRLAAEPARLCGLLPGTPIVAGCGDQAATSLGAGIARKGKVFDSAGTASVFSVCVDKYKPDIKNKTFLYARSVIPGLWIPLAYINGGGLCLKWFRDNIAGGEAARSYGELDGEAASIPPGSEGLIFIPHFNGRVCPNNPDARGGWLGLSWVHTKAHMFRAVMEGIAYEYKYYLDIIKELVGDAGFESVYAMGGGAKSTLFNTIKANVLGIEYRPLNCTDAAPLGSAVVAGYGVGVYKDLAQTAESFISSAMQIRPDPGEHELYRPYAETYAKLVERTAFRLNR